MSKTLDEFIQTVSTNVARQEIGHGALRPIIRAAMLDTSAEILRYAREKSFVHYDYTLAPNEKIVMIKDLEYYINGKVEEEG